MTQQEAVSHWRDGAKEAFHWAQQMHAAGSYPLALFHCHLSLEKALKALYLEMHNSSPPFTHNLQKIAFSIQNTWSDDVISTLEMITPFCQEARYGDEHWVEQQATPEFTQSVLEQTDQLLTCFDVSTHD